MQLGHLWDFNDLNATRQRFEALLQDALSAEHNEKAACVLTQLARIDGLERAFAEAKAKIDRARALAPAESAEAASRIALEAGRIARDRGDSSAAETAFQCALDRAREAGLAALALDALHMQAIAAPPERAMQLADEAQAMVAAADPGLRHWLGPILNNLGWTLFDAGRLDEALECFSRDSVLRAELGAQGERQIADWNAGFVLRQAGRLDEAEATQSALETEIGETGAGIAFVFEERAELSAAKGDRSAARHYAEKAIAAHRADGLSGAQEPEKFARLAALCHDDSDPA